MAARRAEYRQSVPRLQVRFRRYDRRMRPIVVIAGVVLIGGGMVWIAQGLNLPFAPRSFMTADRTWVVLGAAAVVAGGLLVWRGRQPA
jgi:hypothetical protein